MEVEKNYKMITTLGAKSKERLDHSTTWTPKGNKVIMFEGQDSEYAGLGETHELDLNTMTWRLVEIHGTKPPARAYHTVCLSTDQS